jgi:SAM-dependent methyltransferase
VELAHVYFRLANYLASQGYTVVIAAVAMYDEVREWLRDNLPEVFEVYLDVPEAERVRRDEHTKRVYPQVQATNRLYDVPTRPGLAVPNFGDTSPEDAALAIVEAYLDREQADGAGVSREAHWERFYTGGFTNRRPSSFAQHVAETELGEGARILEIGCGNGRDAFYFASLGHEVVGIDPSAAAIESCTAVDAGGRASFLLGRFPSIRAELSGSFDAVYSRFSLHAMTQEEQDEALAGACSLLADGGKLLIECRSINDPLARQGEIISPTERIHGHYRRFVVREQLVRELESLGLELGDVLEADGLAPYGDEDPVVIRAVASKAV